MARKKSKNALTYPTLPALFTGICDAIRSKTGGTDPINHQDIPSVISGLSGGELIKSVVQISSNFNPYSQFNSITADGSTYIITLLLGNTGNDVGVLLDGISIPVKAGAKNTFPPGTTGSYNTKIWEIKTTPGAVITWSNVPNSAMNGGLILSIVKY